MDYGLYVFGCQLDQLRFTPVNVINPFFSGLESEDCANSVILRQFDLDLMFGKFNKAWFIKVNIHANTSIFWTFYKFQFVAQLSISSPINT